MHHECTRIAIYRMSLIPLKSKECINTNRHSEQTRIDNVTPMLLQQNELATVRRRNSFGISRTRVPISHPGLRQYEFWLSGFGFDLTPQRCNEHPQQRTLFYIIGAPNLLKQFTMRNWFSHVHHKAPEEVVFLGCQANGLAGLSHPSSLKIDIEIVDDELLSAG